MPIRARRRKAGRQELARAQDVVARACVKDKTSESASPYKTRNKTVLVLVEKSSWQLQVTSLHLQYNQSWASLSAALASCLRPLSASVLLYRSFTRLLKPLIIPTECSSSICEYRYQDFFDFPSRCPVGSSPGHVPSLRFFLGRRCRLPAPLLAPAGRRGASAAAAAAPPAPFAPRIVLI